MHPRLVSHGRTSIINACTYSLTDEWSDLQASNSKAIALRAEFVLAARSACVATSKLLPSQPTFPNIPDPKRDWMPKSMMAICSYVNCYLLACTANCPLQLLCVQEVSLAFRCILCLALAGAVALAGPLRRPKMSQHVLVWSWVLLRVLFYVLFHVHDTNTINDSLD